MLRLLPSNVLELRDPNLTLTKPGEDYKLAAERLHVSTQHEVERYLTRRSRQVLRRREVCVQPRRLISYRRFSVSRASWRARDGLREDRLLLLSEVSPSAPFSVGNAMSRNRLVHSFADVAIVANSGAKGGTWAGSTENLRHNWVPLLVREAEDAGEGTVALLENGALPLSDGALGSPEEFVQRARGC